MQEVNLLSDELIPRHDPFTLREFGIAWTLLLVLLGAMSCWQVYSQSVVTSELDTRQQTLAGIQRQLEELQTNGLRQADAALTKTLATLTDKRNDYRKLVSVLQGETLSSGFQGHLRDLATTHMRQLWFDTVEITHGGEHIYLAGFSKAPELVPLYLSMLSEGEAFAGYNFDGLEIKRESDVLVSFEIRGPALGEAQ